MTRYPDTAPYLAARQFSVGTDVRTTTSRGAVLEINEIRLILDGTREAISEFAQSPRVHIADPKGDTGLHLAARIGDLALCDLFRQGANPEHRNHGRQTPADVALEEGHLVVASLQSSLVTQPANVEPAVPSMESPLPASEITSTRLFKPNSIQQLQQAPGAAEEFADLVCFEAEHVAEDFFLQNTSKTISATFAPLLTSDHSTVEDHESQWDLDLSPASIAGEGIRASPNARTTIHVRAEQDFLKVKNRGRRSTKPALVQNGTHLSIEGDECRAWVDNVLARGWCSSTDIDHRAASCGGNTEPNDLQTSLQRNLEALGFDLADQLHDDDVRLLDAKTDIRFDDMIESIEATRERTRQIEAKSLKHLAHTVLKRRLQELLGR